MGVFKKPTKPRSVEPSVTTAVELSVQTETELSITGTTELSVRTTEKSSNYSETVKSSSVIAIDEPIVTVTAPVSTESTMTVCSPGVLEQERMILDIFA